MSVCDSLMDAPPPAKRLCIKRNNPNFISSLPDEILAYVFKFVDDIWLKLKCKSVNRQFRRVLGMNESWEGTQITIELVNPSFSGPDSLLSKPIRLNGRRFSSKLRLQSVENVLALIPKLKRIEYHGEIRDDLTFVNAFFSRLETFDLTHLSYSVRSFSQLKPLPDILSCYCSSLRVFTLAVHHENDPYKPTNSNQIDLYPIWNALVKCNQLNRCSLLRAGQLHVSVHSKLLNNVISSMYTNLRKLELLGNFGDQGQEFITTVSKLPYLKQLSINIDPWKFFELLTNVHNDNINLLINGLHFSTALHRPVNMNKFILASTQLPNLMSLSMPGYDPTPILDYLFNLSKDIEHPFEFNWLSEVRSDMLLAMFRRLVSENGFVNATPSRTLDEESKPIPTYFVVKNNASILFTVKSSVMAYRSFFSLPSPPRPKIIGNRMLYRSRVK